MWQELSGKRKNTQARFLFPILFNGMISSACTHLVGQFRWELVRTIQGTSWNDLRNAYHIHEQERQLLLIFPSGKAYIFS